MNNINIRNEVPSDYKRVEDITRRAFYNIYMPGAIEHYLVTKLREHEDFVKELDLVLELDGIVIANVMYTKAKLTDENGKVKEILTFGPLTVEPEMQRKGYGKLLLDHSFEIAKNLGYDVIVIFGTPGYYVSRGFKSCKKYNIAIANGKFPTAMMVKELKPNSLDGRKYIYSDSPVMDIDLKEAEKYDNSLSPMEKRVQTSQEEFYILSHSFVEDEQSV